MYSCCVVCDFALACGHILLATRKLIDNLSKTKIAKKKPQQKTEIVIVNKMTHKSKTMCRESELRTVEGVSIGCSTSGLQRA